MLIAHPWGVNFSLNYIAVLTYKCVFFTLYRLVDIITVFRSEPQFIILLLWPKYTHVHCNKLLSNYFMVSTYESNSALLWIFSYDSAVQLWDIGTQYFFLLLMFDIFFCSLVHKATNLFLLLPSRKTCRIVSFHSLPSFVLKLLGLDLLFPIALIKRILPLRKRWESPFISGLQASFLFMNSFLNVLYLILTEIYRFVEFDSDDAM